MHLALDGIEESSVEFSLKIKEMERKCLQNDK